MTYYIFAAALSIMLISLAGVFFVGKHNQHWMRLCSKYLITFSMGVFLVVVYNLLGETIELHTSIPVILFSMLAGVITLEVAGRIIPKAHHHHEIGHDHAHTTLDARRMLFGDAIHNIGDGIILVPAFMLDIRIGIATTVAILLHELVQEVSEFFVLKEAGYTNAQALVRNFLVSSTIIIGVLIGLYATNASSFIAPLLSFAAGGFMYIIARDLAPHTYSAIKRTRQIRFHILAFVLGLLLMFGIGVIAPHESHDGAHVLYTQHST